MAKRRRHSDATRKKMSIAHMGLFAGKKHPMYGTHHTHETLIKMSYAKKGKKQTKEHVRKRVESRDGYLHSEATKKKIGSANKGNKRPDLAKRNKINKRRTSKNPNWQGGISKLPYSFDFDRQLKELIRKRDNRTCQLCGKRKRANYDLTVHHIDYDKQNSNPKNLITLCRSCNNKVNSGRKQWTRFFQSKLKLIGA